MKLKEYLKQLIPTLHGKMIVIGIEYEEINQMILQSKSLKQCYFLDSNVQEEKKKKKGKKTYHLGKNKTISIKKFRKTFKKKKTETIICNFNEIAPYLKTFVKDSVYICKGKVYYYGSKRKLEAAKLKEHYQRYQVSIEEVKLENSMVFIVDTSKAKTKWYKEFCYWIKDSFARAIDLFGDYLVN